MLDKFVQNLEAAGAMVNTVEDHHHKNIVPDKEIIKNMDDIGVTFKKISKQYKDSVEPDKLYQFLLQLHDKANNV